MDVLPVPSPKRASRAHTQKLAITLSPKHVKSAATDVQLSRLNGGIPVGIVPRERAPSPHVAKGIIVGGSGDLTPIILHNALQRRLGHAVIPPSLPPKLPPRIAGRIGQVGVRTSSSQHGNAYNGRLSRARSDSMHDYMNGRSQSDGTVILSKEESHAVHRNLSRKEGKIRRLWWYIAIGCALATVFLAILYATFLAAAETAKETHVADGRLETLSGNTVMVRKVESFGDISSLVKFDSQTLSRVTLVNMKLQDGGEVSFLITGLHKEPTFRHKITFFTPGGRIVIDLPNGIFQAIEGDQLYTGVTPRQTGNSNGRRHLFSHMEFFNATIQGQTSGRRSLAASAKAGWAALHVAAGEEVLANEEEAVSGTAEFVVYKDQHQTIFDAQFYIEPYTGMFTLSATSPDGDIMYINEEVHITGRSEGGFFRADSCLSTPFDIVRYNSLDASLEAVLRHNVEADFDFKNVHLTGSAKLSVDVNLQCGLYLELTLQESGGKERKLRETPEGRRELGLRKYQALYSKGFKSFMASKESASHAYGLDTAARRRRAEAVDDLAALVYDADPGQGYKSYAKDNAFAISKDCHFAFRGTDDFSDWISNVNSLATYRLSPYHQVWFRMHQGFVNEWNQLRGLMLQDIMECGPDAVFIGHSLGGAMATVAYEDLGKHATVYTFGAPRPYRDIKPGGCRVKGLRMWHEFDPVPTLPPSMYGNFFMHAQNSLKLNECTGSSIFQCTATWVWTKETCDAAPSPGLPILSVAYNWWSGDDAFKDHDMDQYARHFDMHDEYEYEYE